MMVSVFVACLLHGLFMGVPIDRLLRIVPLYRQAQSPVAQAAI